MSQSQSPGRTCTQGHGLHGGLLLLCAFVLGLCVVSESDTPWYLRAGEEILRLGSIPAQDPFSYTSHQPWLNHEWLAEVLLALCYRAFRAAGLVVLQGLILASVILALRWAAGTGRASRLSGLSPAVYALTAALLREGISPRAQLFSDVLFALVLALCLRDAAAPHAGRRSRDPLLWTLPIGLLWTQMHGGNPHQVALLGLLFLSGPSLRRAAFVLLAVLLTCAGPYGIRVHEHFLGAHATLPFIREWHPLWTALTQGAWSYKIFVAFDLLAFAGLVVRARRGERVRFPLLALLVFTALAFRYVRFVTEATIVAGAVLGPALLGALPRPASSGMAMLITMAAMALSSRTPGFSFSQENYPMGAVAYLQRTHPPGPLFNSYNFGGYLMWAYPSERVFIDGRAFTVYSEEQVRELLAIYEDPPRFQELERRHGFRLLVLKREGRGQALLGWVRERPEWRVVYEDGLAVVLVRVSGGN